MSLAGSLGAAGLLRLALCSVQYSRQCRSWEWMKRHMSQAWAAHTSSSTQSLQGRVGSSGGSGPQPRAEDSRSRDPAEPCHPQPGVPPPPHQEEHGVQWPISAPAHSRDGLRRPGRRQRQTQPHCPHARLGPTACPSCTHSTEHSSRPLHITGRIPVNYDTAATVLSGFSPSTALRGWAALDRSQPPRPKGLMDTQRLPHRRGRLHQSVEDTAIESKCSCNEPRGAG